MKLKLKNIGVGVQDVRIIRLTEETSLNNSEGIFTEHDPNSIEFGVQLGEVPPSMQYTKISTGEIVQLRLGDSITHPNQIDPDIDFDADWTDEQLAEYNARMENVSATATVATVPTPPQT